MNALSILERADDELVSTGREDMHAIAADLADARAKIAELLSAGDFMASNPIGMLTDGAINRWNKAAKAVRGGA